MAKLVIPGGNGFIGSQICRLAVKQGHDVAAFGRTGRPSLTPARHPWVESVEWRAADVFEPDTWRALLDGADAVVHCIATLREKPGRGITYERLNAESALLAAAEAENAGAEAFVYLSVRDKPPLVPSAFLEAKRRAERDLRSSHPNLRTVSLRPNLVYGPGSPGSATLAGILERLPGGLAGPYAEREGRPLPVELVAATALHAAITHTIEGTLTVSQISDMGRTSGLVDLDDVSTPTLTPVLAGLGGTALALWLLRRWRS